jgi:signal transduction histidine kinase
VITAPLRIHGGHGRDCRAGLSLQPTDHLLDRVRLVLLLVGDRGGGAQLRRRMGSGAGRAVRPPPFAGPTKPRPRSPPTRPRASDPARLRPIGRRGPGGHRSRSRRGRGAEVDHLSALTDRLLALARSDAGVLPVQVRPVEIRELCESAAARGRRALGVQVGRGHGRRTSKTLLRLGRPGGLARRPGRGHGETSPPRRWEGHAHDRPGRRPRLHRGGRPRCRD